VPYVQSNNNQKYRFIPIVIISYNINNTAMKVSTAVVTSITILFVTCSQVKQHGIIWLDGITGFPGQTAGLRINMCTVIRLALGLSSSVEVACPTEPRAAVTVVKSTWPVHFGHTQYAIPSWFDIRIDSWLFNILPGVPETSIGDLENTSRFLDYIVEGMMEQGIPSQKIVVAGFSQGGALTLYHAVHSKYKLGGFICLASWYPNLLADPSVYHNIINDETPVLQVNGHMDPVILISTAGQTAEALSGRFADYTFRDNPFDGHITTLNPVVIRGIKNWLQSKNLLSFNMFESVEDTYNDILEWLNPTRNSPVEFSLSRIEFN